MQHGLIHDDHLFRFNSVRSTELIRVHAVGKIACRELCVVRAGLHLRIDNRLHRATELIEDGKRHVIFFRYRILNRRHSFRSEWIRVVLREEES